MKISNNIIDKINMNYLEEYLQEKGRPTGKGETFLCIHHPDKNPSMFYFRDSREANKKALCRSCKKKANIVDFVLYDEEEITTREQAVKFLCDKYNIKDIKQIEELPDYKEAEQPEEEIKLQEEMFPYNLKENLIKAREDNYLHKQLAMNYFKERGLTEKTIDKYLLTLTMKFNDTMQEPMKSNNEGLSSFIKGGYIFPFIDTEGKYSYIMEKPLIKEREFSNGEKKPLEKYYKPVGNSILFNERYLQEKQEEYIFICEGLFDSLSVEEMDFKSIALLTTNQARFYKLLEKLNPKNKTFILLLDNDEAGTTGEEKIAKYLAKNNYNFIKHSDYEKTQTEWKDSNEFLVKNKEEFKEYLKYLQKEAQIMKESKDITNESMMKKIDTFFSKAEAKFFEPIATGFSKIDEITNGGILTQSLLTLGGGTSTGKTTFSLNLALNIAEKRPVIYYTLEMAEEMIEAKLFSHIAYKGKGIKVASDKFLKCYDENKMTSYQKEKIKEELAKHKELEQFFVKYPEDYKINSILKNAREINEKLKEKGKEPAILFIDYLQYIQGEPREDLQATIKRIQKGLKQYAIENNSFVVLMIANSRQATTEGQQTTISSGRDSSDIEYSSDYNLQLNFTEWEKQTRPNATRTELIAKIPRKMTITIHKNRMGSTGEMIDFEFNPIANTYEEISKVKYEEEPEEESYSFRR